MQVNVCSALVNAHLPHTSFVGASQGNSQRACSATKAGNSFSESYLEI